MDDPLEAQAPPAAQPDEARRQLPSLPTEILQRIIHLALPLLSFTTFGERNAALLELCRVNKAWAAVAQVELWSHVQLGQPASHSLGLIRARAASSAKHPRTRSLWMLGAPTSRITTARVCRGLSALYFAGRGSTGYIRPSLLSGIAPDLEVLVLGGCSVKMNRRDPLLFPRLRHLALSFLKHNSAEAVADFFSGSELPLLQHLTLSLDDQGGAQSTLGAMLTSLRHCLPNLNSLAFAAPTILWTELPHDLWPALTSLKHLVLDSDAPLSEILPLITTSLETFRLGPAFAHPQLALRPFLDALKRRPPCLLLLKEMTIPLEEIDKARIELLAVDDLADEREEVMRWSEERDVKVVLRPHIAFNDTVGHLEDALSCWRARC